MNKQEATDYILTQLQSGKTRKEIVKELSNLLNAPEKIVESFVVQVVSSNPEAANPPQKITNKAEGLESTPIRADTSPAGQSYVLDNSDLPPGIQALLNEGIPNINDPPKISQAQTDPTDNHSISEIELPKQANLEASVHQIKPGQPDLEVLENFVLQQLKKQRRHNDIVEAVCNRTGWHWNTSQRFVAKTQTKHHDDLQSSRNRIPLIFGIGLILIGLFMAVNGVISLSDYVKFASVTTSTPEILLNISPQRVLFTLGAIVTGLGMVIGGSYGITRALSSR
jgi:hypothetical protein